MKMDVDVSRTDSREIELTADSHFYNIPVNTSYSSVHIPTNVFDLTQEVVEDIARTELLDDTFRQNYESDPALSWQYFGSVTGVLRHYPAMQWRTSVEDDDDEPPADLYDCRMRSWFIEAATCSKDMVILMDISGSMTGMGKTIGTRDREKRIKIHIDRNFNFGCQEDKQKICNFSNMIN